MFGTVIVYASKNGGSNAKVVVDRDNRVYQLGYSTR